MRKLAAAVPIALAAAVLLSTSAVSGAEGVPCERACWTKLRAQPKLDRHRVAERFASADGVRTVDVDLYRRRGRGKMRSLWGYRDGEVCVGHVLNRRLAARVKHCGDPTRPVVRYAALGRPQTIWLRVKAYRR